MKTYKCIELSNNKKCIGTQEISLIRKLTATDKTGKTYRLGLPAHIVKCVNLHDELMQELPLIIAQAYNGLNMPNASEDYLREQLKKVLKHSEAILKLAKGGE